MPLLETVGLSKSFDGLRAISNLDVDIEAGSIHGLIGPNGSGKSTFFNLVTGVYQPDPGSKIFFDGHRHYSFPVTPNRCPGYRQNLSAVALVLRNDRSAERDGWLSYSCSVTAF